MLSTPAREWSFEAIGTAWWIGVYQELPNGRWQGLRQSIAARIDTFDRTYSRFQADSLVSAVAQAAGAYRFPEDSTKLFALYRTLYEATNGKVTPLIGKVLSDAGYDAAYSLQPKALSTPPDWEATSTFRSELLTTSQSLLFDFGAAGKGYLVDIVSELLDAEGITGYCVDAGGDMRCFGLFEALQVGLEDPDDSSQAIGVVSLLDAALCGSAGNRRRWAGYNHIMDPERLESPDHIKAVWVSAESAAVADGLTTALYFVEPEKLSKHFRFEYLIVYNDSSMRYSLHFPAELFTEEVAHA